MNNEERGTNVDVDADIANMRSSAPQYQTQAPDTSPEALMSRFQRQQEQENLAKAREIQNLQASVTIEEIPSLRVKEIKETFIPAETRVAPKPSMSLDAANPTSIRARINEVEARLGINDAIPLNGKTYNAQSYVDDLGDETFYVQNISNGHVLVTDLDLKIPRGKTIDLLKFCDLESIKKSKDIRVALANNPRSGAMIKRLTPEEYLAKMDQNYKEEVKIENFKKLASIRQANGTPADNKYSEPVKPVVYDKLNKLKLSYSDTPHKGISPVEFAQWVQSEDLSKADLDQILAQIDDNELRILVNERKKLLLERS